MIDRVEYSLNIAKVDDNIRGMLLYGSRANDNVNPDRYQDYDIIFIVTDIENFDISIFKDIKIRFNASEVYPDLFQEEITCLMLFEDDSRIDLTVCSIDIFLSRHSNGQPMKCLLDKDNVLGKSLLIDNKIYNIKQMNERTFNNTCAEFLWEIQNVVKGLKRDQLSYAMFLRDVAMRDMLNRMIDNYIGINNNYSVTTGTLGKYRKKFLSKKLYALYKNTYLSNTTEDVWVSLRYMIDLFSLTGMKIAEVYGYYYPKIDELHMRDYVKRVKDFID